MGARTISWLPKSGTAWPRAMAEHRRLRFLRPSYSPTTRRGDRRVWFQKIWERVVCPLTRTFCFRFVVASLELIIRLVDVVFAQCCTFDFRRLPQPGNCSRLATQRAKWRVISQD